MRMAWPDTSHGVVARAQYISLKRAFSCEANDALRATGKTETKANTSMSLVNPDAPPFLAITGVCITEGQGNYTIYAYRHR